MFLDHRALPNITKLIHITKCSVCMHECDSSHSACIFNFRFLFLNASSCFNLK